jgi:hypothetical protein
LADICVTCETNSLRSSGTPTRSNDCRSTWSRGSVRRASGILANTARCRWRAPKAARSSRSREPGIPRRRNLRAASARCGLVALMNCLPNLLMQPLFRASRGTRSGGAARRMQGRSRHMWRHPYERHSLLSPTRTSGRSARSAR